MPNKELEDAINQAAQTLGVEVPAEQHAEELVKSLAFLRRNPISYSWYEARWSPRPDHVIKAAEMSSAQELKLDGGEVWSALLIWNYNGNNNMSWSRSKPSPHTLSLVLNNPRSLNQDDPDSRLSVREARFANTGQSSMDLQVFPSIQRVNRTISPTTQFLVAQTVVHF